MGHPLEPLERADRTLARLRWKALASLGIVVVALVTVIRQDFAARAAVEHWRDRAEIMEKRRDEAFAERRQALAWVFYFWAHSKDKMPESHQLAMIRSFRERFPTYDEDPKLARLAEQALMFRRGMAPAKDLEAAYQACLEE